MKPKIIFTILLLGLAVLALEFFRSKPSVAVPPAGVQAGNTAAKTDPPPGASKMPVPLPSPAAVAGNPPPAPARTTDELEALGMRHDADALQAILAELTNSDPEIRAAARKAAVQFGDRAAAPELRAAAARTADADEQRELREAADFLELPPLEIRAGTNAAAR